MITEVNIVDPGMTTVGDYVKDVFKEPRKFEFRPGVNLVIGPNGSGKTTLLKMIQNFTMTYQSPFSEAPVTSNPYEILEYNRFFKDSSVELKKGCLIKAYWAAMTFRYLPANDLRAGQEMASLGNIGSYVTAAGSSTGETTMQGVNRLFSEMFDRKDYNFPLNTLKADIEKYKGDGYWEDRLKNLLRYYLENNIDIPAKDFEYTVLMDEPDKNLDIKNTKQIYSILSYHKEMTQIIAVIHNPLLIYKLSKLPDINFIEMKPGYKNEIIKFVEG